MVETTITVINKLGLHARAASKFVTTASAFAASTTVSKDGRSVDGKSIMSIMMLAASQGSQLHIACEGEDENLALDAITALINDYFGEGE
ncbi:HPr family phosphocarrier protein [Spongiibacter sp. KMU-158]|uniref:HPr family phosphocarrier protein n=1 Tax=Spongiibacter pelagi TaxID=2760804 RepID=A0A927GWQ0_9GAMM|nr:HPr family phosphocarrier protein [Spongiibacter pelagi]MBD2859700.1 HPr family phosphocarrier protein [Spongiibacter pelagi]